MDAHMDTLTRIFCVYAFLCINFILFLKFYFMFNVYIRHRQQKLLSIIDPTLRQSGMSHE